MFGNQCVVTTLPVTDIERARAFYAQSLRLRELQGTRPEEVVFDTGAGTRIHLYHREAPTISNQTACAFQVRDLEKTMADLRSRGVVFENFDQPGLKTVDGVAVWGPIRSAWFKDPDGNVLGLTQGHEVLRPRVVVHTNGNGAKKASRNGHSNGRTKTARAFAKRKNGRRTVAVRSK